MIINNSLLSLPRSILGNPRFVIWVAIALIGVLWVRQLQISLLTLLLIIIAGVILLWMEADRTQTGQNHLDRYLEALKSPLFQGTRFFYLSPQLISWITSIQHYRKYNLTAFTTLTRSLDRLLRLRREFEISIDLPGHYLEMAINWRRAAQNALHSLIFSLPSEELALGYHSTHMAQLKELTDPHLAFMYNRTRQIYAQGPINTRFKMVYPHHPRGYDPVDDKDDRSYCFF